MNVDFSDEIQYNTKRIISFQKEKRSHLSPRCMTANDALNSPRQELDPCLYLGLLQALVGESISTSKQDQPASAGAIHFLYDTSALN